LKKGKEKKTLFEKLFVSPNLLRSEKALFRTSTIQGIRDKSTLESEEPKKQFDMLKLHLEAFADIELETKDYELAAEYFNAARKKGIQGSNTDFLICAISSRRKMPILTTDKDFANFQSIFHVNLHVPRR